MDNFTTGSLCHVDSEFFVTINCGKNWSPKKDGTISDVTNAMSKRIIQSIENDYVGNNVQLNICYEEGSNNSPHYHIYVTWEDGYNITADAFKNHLSNILADDDSAPLADVDVKGVTDEKGLQEYMRKEMGKKYSITLGDWFDCEFDEDVDENMDLHLMSSKNSKEKINKLVLYQCINDKLKDEPLLTEEDRSFLLR